MVMAQLYYRYGSMGSGKSIDILKVKHNYEETGKKVALLTSALDTRSGVGVVSSRIGLSSPAIPIKEGDNILKEISKWMGTTNLIIDCVLVDEAQFLTTDHVRQLADIVDLTGTPVICYGLKNDFQNRLFEGTVALLIYADKIEEIKTICAYCDRKATMNLRLDNGNPVYNGAQVQIGGDESYVPVCRRHYNNPEQQRKGQ